LGIGRVRKGREGNDEKGWEGRGRVRGGKERKGRDSRKRGGFVQGPPSS